MTETIGMLARLKELLIRAFPMCIISLKEYLTGDLSKFLACFDAYMSACYPVYLARRTTLSKDTFVESRHQVACDRRSP